MTDSEQYPAMSEETHLEVLADYLGSTSEARDFLAAHDAEVARAAAEKAWKQGAQWAAVECGAIDRQENLWVTDEENPYRLEQTDD